MTLDTEETGRVADLGAELIGLVGEVPQRRSWPSVSAIVPTHNGRQQLQMLLRGLSGQTDYPDLEVIVVDNASSDGTLEWVQAQAFPFALIVIRNPRNFSFSAAVNVGAARARGELLLFLNDDVEPIERGWLARLVTTFERPGTAISGAVLVDPERRSHTGRPVAVQHDGIAFALDGGVLRPLLLGLGSDPSAVIERDREVAAVAAACAMVRKREFEAVGGFDERFRYGCEDIDLCLRLAQRGGAITISRTAVLLHRPLSTRRGSPDGTRDAVRANHTLLLERWGPALRREYALDPGDRPPVFNGDGGVADARVSYCVKSDPGGGNAEARRVTAELEQAGHPAHESDGSDAWLLDDVVVHLFDGVGRHALRTGRINVLLCVAGEPPEGEASQYDVVIPVPGTTAELLTAVETEIGRRGGPRRAGRAVTIAAVERAQPEGSNVVVVLGMARTGTSTTMRMLNLLGVDVGEPERLLGPIESINEKGFFEHFAMMRLNAAVLQRLGGSWRDPPPLPVGWESDPEFDDLRERAAAIIADEFADKPLWGFKDPRLCLTLPFWLPLIGPARFVVCARHPLEIAASLERRDGLTTEQSIALWRLYTASAIAATAGERRIIVGYREALADPLTAADALAAFIGVPERAAEPAVRREIEDWVEPRLRHHERTHLDLLEDPRLDPLDVTLALLLELAGASAENDLGALDPVARRVLDAIAEPAVAADH